MIDRKTHDIITEISQLERDLQEIKAAQRVGSPNIITYVNQTGAEWDINWEPSSTPNGQNHVITFKPDLQTTPFASIGFRALINDSLEYDINYVQGVDIWTYLNVYDPAFRTQVDEIQWVTMIEAWQPVDSIRIKFKVWATDTGTITTALL